MKQKIRYQIYVYTTGNDPLITIYPDQIHPLSLMKIDQELQTKLKARIQMKRIIPCLSTKKFRICINKTIIHNEIRTSSIIFCGDDNETSFLTIFS